MKKETLLRALEKFDYSFEKNPPTEAELEKLLKLTPIIDVPQNEALGFEQVACAIFNNEENGCDLLENLMSRFRFLEIDEDAVIGHLFEDYCYLNTFAGDVYFALADCEIKKIWKGCK